MKEKRRRGVEKTVCTQLIGFARTTGTDTSELVMGAIFIHMV